MHKGEIWHINLDPILGAEIRKTRPAVIISEDAIGILPLRVIVPLTDWKERFAVAPWMIAIAPDAQNGLTKPSAADAFQIRSVAQERFVQCLGKLNSDQVSQILKAVQIVIGAASTTTRFSGWSLMQRRIWPLEEKLAGDGRHK